MRRTTEQREELLDEATPTSATGLVIPTDADERLAAHAPAAVAEVVRLRQEVAALRDQMTNSAERRKAMYDRGRDLDFLLDAASDWEIASTLTRILEGEEQ